MASPIHDAALLYLAQGWPVLPVVLPDGNSCSCPKGDRCDSAGKHPRLDLVAHGWQDATLDPAVVIGWPDDINIGVSLGAAAGGVMVFDCDLSAIAAKLTHPDYGLADQTAVAVTGKGAHIWFRSKGPTKTFHLRGEHGEHIGEVRGDGSYVVVPPSLSATGRQYRWLQHRRDGPPPQLAVTADPAAYVVGMLADLGITAHLAADRPQNAEHRNGAVVEVEIPAAIAKDSRLTRLRQLARGNLTVPDDGDRSSQLYAWACDIAAAAHQRGYALSMTELAGILKYADTHAFNEPKYAGRADADDRYWELASKTHINGTSGAEQGETPPPPPDGEAPPP